MEQSFSVLGDPSSYPYRHRQRSGSEADISLASYEEHDVLHILTPRASKGIGSTDSDISQ